jgi:hypothetical protein
VEQTWTVVLDLVDGNPWAAMMSLEHHAQLSPWATGQKVQGQPATFAAIVAAYDRASAVAAADALRVRYLRDGSLP